MENKASVPEVLDFDGLCGLLLASRPTVKAMEKRGEGPPFVLIGRRRRYPVAALRSWLDEKAGGQKAV